MYYIAGLGRHLFSSFGFFLAGEPKVEDVFANVGPSRSVGLLRAAAAGAVHGIGGEVEAAVVNDVVAAVVRRSFASMFRASPFALMPALARQTHCVQTSSAAFLVMSHPAKGVFTVVSREVISEFLRCAAF